MGKKTTKGTAAVFAATGLAIFLQGPAWAASGSQSASGTVLIMSETVHSTRVADGNTIRLITVSGVLTGTFNGPFTENDREVIRSDGSVTLQGKGIQSGTLGICGTGSAPYVTELRGTVSTISGRFQTIDQAASTSTPTKIHSVDTLTVNATGDSTYAGTYHCT